MVLGPAETQAVLLQYSKVFDVFEYRIDPLSAVVHARLVPLTCVMVELTWLALTLAAFNRGR